MITPKDIARILQRLKFTIRLSHEDVDEWVSRDKRTDVDVFDNGQWTLAWEEVRERGRGARELVQTLKGFVESKGIREAMFLKKGDRVQGKGSSRQKGTVIEKPEFMGVSATGGPGALTGRFARVRWDDEPKNSRSIPVGKLKRLKERVREIVEQEIDEMTGTGAVGGFGTPYAFSTKEPVSSKKKKVNEDKMSSAEMQSNLDYWRQVKSGNSDYKDKDKRIKYWTNKIKKATGKHPEAGIYTEGGDPYYAWRNDETQTPRMKIGNVISEINKQLKEMEKVVRRSSRLKKEMGVPNSGLWQRTNNALMKIESRMHRISQTIRNMRG